MSKVFVDVITQALSSSSLWRVLCLEDADLRNLGILTDRTVHNRLINLPAVLRVIFHTEKQRKGRHI